MGVKISVVMVTYNHQKYISQAINSVIKQSMFSECEVLIGDDGSQDDTVRILREFEKKYLNIHVYAHENQGLSKNVYALFSKAQGEYIAILEGDDYWIDNKKLRKQLKEVESLHCLASACNSKIVDEKEKFIGLWKENIESHILTRKEIEKQQTSLFHPSALFLKNIFAGSNDKYHIIADASRMGGNHSGMINLLGSLGEVYWNCEPYTIWRKIVSVDGTNYSSQQYDKLEDEHEALQKYFTYKDKFGFEYKRQIYGLYCSCQDILNNELKKNMGAIRYIECKLYAVARKVYALIRRNRK